MDKSCTNLTSKKGPSRLECVRFIEKFKSVVLLKSDLSSTATKFERKTEVRKLYDQKAGQKQDDMLKHCNMFRITIGGDYVITINTSRNVGGRNQTKMDESRRAQINGIGEDKAVRDTTNKEDEKEHDTSDKSNEIDTNTTEVKDSIQIIVKPPTPSKSEKVTSTTMENDPILIAPAIVKSLEKIEGKIIETSIGSKPGPSKPGNAISRCKCYQREPENTQINEPTIDIGTFTNTESSNTITREQTHENEFVIRSDVSEMKNNSPGVLSLKENSKELYDRGQGISDAMLHLIENSQEASFDSRETLTAKLSLTDIHNTKEEMFDTRIQTAMLADVSSESLCRILSAVLEELTNVHRNPVELDVATTETSEESSLDLDSNILVMSDNYYVINIEQLRSIGGIMDRIDKVLEELMKHQKFLHITRSKLDLSTRTPNTRSKVQYVCTTKKEREKTSTAKCSDEKREENQSTGTTSTFDQISPISPTDVLLSPGVSSSKTEVNPLSNEDASGTEPQEPIAQDMTSSGSNTDTTVTGGDTDTRPRRKSDRPKTRFQALRNSQHHQDAVNTAKQLLDLLTDVEKLLISNCADRYEMMLLLEQILNDYSKSARKAVADLKKLIVTFNKNNSYL